tara:strand:+ start:3880 stop:4341 length:462 start_codon:yes stop_codon:yes gene_type:complete
MNQYSQLLYYIKALGESDEFINTITKGEDIDLDKANIFPLLNIEINGGSFTNGSTLVFNVELNALDIRDVNKEVSTNKFWLNSNDVDNHNEMLAVLNRIWTKMLKDFDDNNITASESPSFIKITDENTNRLDGWALTFDVEMPNTTLRLCDEC